MSRPFVPPPPRVVDEIRALAERQLSVEEFDAYVSAPMSEAEAAGIDALYDWFTRRYPTPAARLRQARLAYRQWARSMPPGTRSG